MADYTIIGQLPTAVRWADGALDDPASVLVVCDTCAAVVPYLLTSKHDILHPVTTTTKAVTK